MTAPDNSPVLADAADVLSDQLRLHMRRLGSLIGPHSAQLDKRFEARLTRMRLGAKAVQALSAITPGAMAKVLAGGRSTGNLFEQVEYYGRRLAKLNVAPTLVVEALQQYDKLLTPVLKKLIPHEHLNFQWVREQLHFCVVLTLNNAYYQVRETETEAFYELFRVEVESRNFEELLGRFLTTLSKFCRADAANLFWRNDDGAGWKRLAAVGCGPVNQSIEKAADAEREPILREPQCWIWSSRRMAAARATLLDADWTGKYRSCWSFPLMAGQRLVGVMQFGFLRTYEWLPREQELLAAAAERCQLGAEKALLIRDLAQREEQIRTLAERMLQVEEAERRRISRELHDEAGQSLLCVRLQLEMMEQALPIEAEALRPSLAAARAETEKTIVEIRRLLAALSPAVLEQLGLAAALRQLVTRFRQMSPARVSLQLGRLQNLPRPMESIVYRLVQECCNNVAKHSKANTLKLCASTADQTFRLSVEDDGIGFSVKEKFESALQNPLEKRDSYGHSGIRERVALMGGRVSIESRPQQGTKILIELPIPKQDHRARSRNLKNVG